MRVEIGGEGVFWWGGVSGSDEDHLLEREGFGWV